MSPVVISLIVTAVLSLVWIVKCFQVTPQASAAIVERFGRYTRILHPGLNIVLPFIDTIRNRIDLREQVIAFPPQPVITQDNLVITIDTVIYYWVTDARAATYEVASYIQAIEQLTVITLRNIIGGMDLERILASREEINAALRGVLDEATGRWGVRVNRVELKSIEPPAAVIESKQQQYRAAHERQATVLRAEGDREAAVLKAKAEREVAELLAQRQEAVRNVQPTQATAKVHPAHQSLRPDDPRSLGRYQLTARLGQGGMGTVYLGRSPGERLVAVKVIQDEYVADPMFRKRFTREIAAVRRVGGFHTAPVVDADPDGAPPWLATEYIPGPSLHEVLIQVGPMPMRTLHTLAVGVAEALEGIHACGIVHRDLKPGNIVVSGTGPRVIDFGLARALDGSQLTRSHHVVGTRGFLAPEQLTGAAITPATDLYAFGMVLCHAAGAVPLKNGESLASALELLPSRLVEIITRCLDHDPAHRPTPAQVLKELAPGLSPSEDWLPPPVRTLVDLHNRPVASAS